jgi:hypothetical protein
MTSRPIQLFVVLSLAVLMLTACATTELTGTWRDESLSDRTFKKIYVIAVARRPEVRIFFEDEYVKQLQAQGVGAIASHTGIPADKMLDKQSIINTIEDTGVDAVLITRLTVFKGKRDVETYRTYKVPYGYYNQMDEYYRKGQEDSQDDAALIKHEIVSLETNIYDAQARKLVWSAASDTNIQDSVQQLIVSFVKEIVKNLGNEEVI